LATKTVCLALQLEHGFLEQITHHFHRVFVFWLAHYGFDALLMKLNHELTLNGNKTNSVIIKFPKSDTNAIQNRGSVAVATTREFDKLLVSAIDEALNSLGESVKQSIYFHIKNNFKLKRDEIPENLVEFQGGLEKIFGAGAQYVEILIMKNLHTKIGRPLKIENKQLEFIEYVDAAKEGFLKKTR
jgi:hypothetical protein